MSIQRMCIAAAAMLSAVCASSAALAECKFVQVGELKVDAKNGPPMVEISVNGKTGKLLIDTSAFATMLTASGAEALGLGAGEQLEGLRVIGSRGEIQTRVVRLRNVDLGENLRIPLLEVLVTPGGSANSTGVVGRLGLDVLAASDVEFDLAHNRVALFSTKDCGKDSLAYWEGSHTEAPMRRTGDQNRLATTISLNGRPLAAAISSATPYSIVDQPAASIVGVKPDSPGSTLLAASGAGGRGQAWVGDFQTFAVGGEQIKNVKLVFSDLYSGMVSSGTGSNVRQQLSNLPSVLLGLDFLRSHRVLISNAQNKIYFSYVGGKVFAQPDQAPQP